MNSIGERIKALRKEQKLTQVQLAQDIGLASSTISGIELGYQVNTTALHRVAERFGVSVRWLETGTGPKYRVEEQIAPQYAASARPMFKTMADAVILLREYLEIRDEPASLLADPSLLQLAYQVVEEHNKPVTPDDMHSLTKRLAALRRAP